jgi:DNA-binding SARP family transcriptional activator/tetratricopeptide (TPR) repeat protein
MALVDPTPEPATKGWRFRLLGPVAATYDGDAVDIGGPTAKAMLAALLLSADTGSTASGLVTTVWGEPGAATHDSVYHYISTLRTRIHTAGPGVRLTARRPGYRLIVADDAVDWRRFRRLEREARTARAARDPHRAVERFAAALRLWTAAPLEGVGDRLQRERVALAERRLALVEDLAEIEAALGCPAEVVTLLMDEVAAAPHRERMVTLLVTALDEVGRRDTAGSVFRRTAAHLRQEFGLDPGAALVAAHRAALHGGSAGRRGPRPTPAESRSGEMFVAPLRADPHFTGRGADLRAIVEALQPVASVAGPVCVVQGMAGVGKTTLAVAAAARLAAKYPHGTVFLKLTGHGSATDALDVLLRRLGVDGRWIPSGFEERAALLQRTLRGQRLLMIFDDARDAAQIRPLLPAEPDSAALVTSRHRLVALDDATVVALDVLDMEHAVGLFRSVVGPERLADEPDLEAEVRRIIERCARLPLAVRIAAARHRATTARRLVDLREQLSDALTALSELDDGERSVAASFRVSVADLPSTTSAALGLLAVHPGPDIDLLAAAAMLDVTPVEAGREIERMLNQHLLVEHRHRRYRLHDLVRAFVRRDVLPAIPEEERRLTMHRLADYYLRAAERADAAITPHRFRMPLVVSHVRAVQPPLDDYARALSWFTDEQHNLAAVCTASTAQGLDRPCWQLAYALRGFYYLTKPWTDWLATHRAALAATQRLGDLRAEAATRSNLGLAHLELDQLDVAAEHYRLAVELATRSGDWHGAETARANYAWVRFSQRRFDDFLVEIQPAYEFYVEHGARRNAAITLRGIGLAEGHLGRLNEAVAHLRDALAEFVELDLRLDAAMAINALGDAYRRVGQEGRAAEAYLQALTAGKRCGSRFEQARAHHRLGELARRRGDDDLAVRHWRTAFDGYQALGAPQADEVRDLLGEAA